MPWIKDVSLIISQICVHMPLLVSQNLSIDEITQRNAKVLSGSTEKGAFPNILTLETVDNVEYVGVHQEDG